MEGDKEFNRHHLIPSSKGGLSTPINVKKVEVKEHYRWHSWCGNDTPVEAICRVLLWNEKLWTENFKADLMSLLDNYINNYYEKGSHKWIIRSEIETVLDLEQTLDKW